MKKSIIMIIFVIVLGIFSGKVIYDKFSVYAFNTNNFDTIYMLQLGVYSNKNMLNNDTKDIVNKLVVKENNNYYVYVGISKDKDNLKKISKIYNKLGYNLYVKEENINDEYFLNNLEQFDILLKSSTTDDEINSINSVILSSYEENIINK